MSKPDQYFIALPADTLCAPIQTMIELNRLVNRLQVPVQFLLSSASNIPRARNYILQQLRRAQPEADTCWTLWVDNDIVIPWNGHRVIATAIERAWDEGVGWTADYAMANGDSVLMRARHPAAHLHYTREELAALPDWHPIGMTGFGLLFFAQPTHYVFHADVTGEDVHFWLEHPEVDIRYARAVQVGHMKSITLDAQHQLHLVPTTTEWVQPPSDPTDASA